MRIAHTLGRAATMVVAVAFFAASAPLPADAAPQMPSPTQRLPKPRPKPKTTKPSPESKEPERTGGASGEKEPPKSEPAKEEQGKQAAAAPIWLDEPVKNWNVAGAPVPPAPKGGQYDSMDDRCKESVRSANAPEDAQVTAAGWFLFGPRQTFNDVTLVSASAGADGMCRPMDHQSFVFVNGTFAGTIAPRPMASRFDGDADRLFLYSAQNLTVEFRRYTSSDPLCCPSGRASVSYTIDRTGASPLLVPISITPTSK